MESAGKQYLAFRLGDEQFALDVANVREILECSTITRVPQAPGCMRGVINLRGSVVPVMDLRLRFGMSETERTVDTCIIVTEFIHGGETLVLGTLADAVQEVFELDPGAVEPPPRIGIPLTSDFITGMGRHDDRIMMILAMDRIFSSDGLFPLPPAAGVSA